MKGKNRGGKRGFLLVGSLTAVLLAASLLPLCAISLMRLRACAVSIQRSREAVRLVKSLTAELAAGHSIGEVRIVGKRRYSIALSHREKGQPVMVTVSWDERGETRSFSGWAVACLP